MQQRLPEATSAIDVGGTTLSINQYQEIFYAITRKKQTVGRAYEGEYIFTLDSVRQIVSIISQSVANYRIIAHSVHIEISHFREETLAFPDVKQLDFYNVAHSKPVFTVLITYKFSLHSTLESGVLSAGGISEKRPEATEYEVQINLVSTACKFEAQDTSSVDSFYLSLSPKPFCRITYVDYTVAVNLISQVDRWFESNQRNSMTSMRKWADRNASDIAFFFGVSAFVALYMSWAWLFAHNLPADTDLKTWAFLHLIPVIPMDQTSRWASGKVQDWLQSLHHLTYIDFNQGDKRLMEKSERRRFKKVRYIIGSFILNIATNILAALALTLRL